MAHYCQSCGAKTILKFADGRYREVCPDCGTISYLQWKVSAGVRVVKDGGLLLVKRGHEPYRDTWHMPAGYVEVDETPAQAAEREAREETGLTVKAGRLVDCYLDTNDPRGHVIILLYEASILDGALTSSPETAEVGFFSPEEAAMLPLAGMSAEKELSDWLEMIRES